MLRVLMNADLDEAIGILVHPGEIDTLPPIQPDQASVSRLPDDNSRWRMRMAQRIAADLDGDRFGVKGIYIIGSTKSGTAGPDADIDLILHVSGAQEKKRELELWLEGWSLALAEMNSQRTGCRRKSLLDIRFITDEDIARQTGIAARIGAATDPARRLTREIS